MIKFLTIIGARPQIIKAAAISRAIRHNFSDKIFEIIVHTGQHYDFNMSDVFFTELEIPKENYNLKIGSGIHGWQTARMIEGIEQIIIKEKPDYLIIYGDTNSTLAGAIAASKLGVRIIHIEAGLRSFNRSMPEETNRILADHSSTLLFSPTRSGVNNLLKEGFTNNNSPPFSADNPGVFHCGDIMYDNTIYFASKAVEKSTILKTHNLTDRKYALATIHRNSNTDNPENLKSIFKAFLHFSKNSNIPVIIPLHPRTKKMLKQIIEKDLYSEIAEESNIKITSPVSFFDMLILEKHSELIFTDSGGVQKEAYFLNKPCIILREETEWVEIVQNKCAILCGADTKKIINAAIDFLNQKELKYPNPFGDGKAAEFICSQIVKNG